MSSVTLVVLECDGEHFCAAKEHLVNIFLMGAKVLKIGKKLETFFTTKMASKSLYFFVQIYTTLHCIHSLNFKCLPAHV